jgi:predicted transcriptional regulator
MNIFRNIREREVSESLPKEKELPAVSRREWIHSINMTENDNLKIHVYNFLITEGHFDVAKTFAEESGLPQAKIEKYVKDPVSCQLVT